MQSDNQRPMTPDELEAHGYPRDHHERRRFALPPLADSQEGMEGIGPDGGIRARQFRAIQPLPLTDDQLEAGLSEARRIINQSAGYYFGGELTTFAPEFKWLALRAIDQLEPR